MSFTSSATIQGVVFFALEMDKTAAGSLSE
jgi:hypothetical protein